MTSTFDTLPKNLKELISFQDEHQMSVHQVIERIRKLEAERREKAVMPEKVALPSKTDFIGKSLKPSSESLKAYAEAMEKYENYEVAKEEARKIQSEEAINVYEIIVEFIKEKSGLNTIPEKYREKVYRFAYENGHSSGYTEVYYYLQELVEIFE